MGAIDITKRIPTLGYQMIYFLLWPKQFVRKFQQGEIKRLSTKEVFGWSIALSIFLFGIYPLIAGHSALEAWNFILGYAKTQEQSHATSSSPQNPTFVKIGFLIGLGAGIDTPEASRLGFDSPQKVIFRAGPGWMLLDNVRPSSLGTKAASTLLLAGCQYFFLLCLYPAARIWHTTTEFRQALWLMNFYVALVWVAGSLLFILLFVVLYDLLRLNFEEAMTGLLTWSMLYGFLLYAFMVIALFVCVLARPF